jgi:ABC-2 type transport system ATP-binding protein
MQSTEVWAPGRGQRAPEAAELPASIQSTSYGAETHDLTKRYGRELAIEGVSLTVPEGSFYLLAGPNGAGKTTTFRLLLGLQSPTRGSARVAGVVASAAGEVRARIGYVPESTSMGYASMRVDALIDYHARFRSAWDGAYADRLIEVLEIRLDRKFGKLSKGQARRVQLLLALAHRPAVLLLDEPTDGLDRVARDTVKHLLVEHMADSRPTVLVASHVAHELEALATHVGLLRKGRLVAQVTREEMHARLRAYEFAAPPDWVAPHDLHAGRRRGSGRDRVWTIWGDEAAVVSSLTASGALVHSSSPLSLDEATLALLTWEEK